MNTHHKKIKVAFFSDVLLRDIDGALKTMYQLIDRIPTDQFEFMFITGTPPKKPLPHRLLKVPSIVIPCNASYKIALPRFYKLKILKELDDFRPDVIHVATPSGLGLLGVKYAEQNNIPTISIYHTHYVSYVKYYFGFIPLVEKAVNKWILKRYDEFYNHINLSYIPSQLMVDAMVGYGVQRERLKVWARGINTKLFNPEKRDLAYIQGITKNDKPKVLFASRLVWEKNLETLFSIYDDLSRQALDVNLIIAGDGKNVKEAKERMPEAFFLGFLPHNELARVYASCETMVFPSISETYGNVVVEAMACGCVPIIARGGGSQALVKNGETGFLCEPNNAEEYVQHIKELLSDKELIENIKQQGFEYTSGLSWERLSRTYFSDIKKLAEKSE